MSTISKSKIVIKQFGSEFMIYDPNSENIHILNSTSKIIWDNIQKEQSVADMVESFANLYPDKSKNQISDDIHKTVKCFKEKGLIA